MRLVHVRGLVDQVRVLLKLAGSSHDLRHSHKTWLIEDDVPEVAQAKRLGHRLPGVRGIYSHVSAAVEQRLVDGLQKRWEQTTPPQPSSQP
jgi:integrase